MDIHSAKDKNLVNLANLFGDFSQIPKSHGQKQSHVFMGLGITLGPRHSFGISLSMIGIFAIRESLGCPTKCQASVFGIANGYSKCHPYANALMGL